MEGDQLVRRVLAGDEAAFVAILDLFEQPLFSYFRRRNVPRVHAEDLVQQVFVTLLEKGDRFDPSAGSLQGFLFGIAWRVWIRYVERASRQPGELPVNLPASASELPERRIIEKEVIQRVRDAMAELPASVREVLNLRMYGQLPLAEISRALDMPVNTVKSHLLRARRLLAGRLDERESSMEANNNEL